MTPAEKAARKASRQAMQKTNAELEKTEKRERHFVLGTICPSTAARRQRWTGDSDILETASGSQTVAVERSPLSNERGFQQTWSGQ